MPAVATYYLTFIKLVRNAVDFGERFGEVIGRGFGGGQDLAADLDRDSAVATSGADELLNAPAGLVSIQCDTASAGNTIVRCASIESRVRW